MAIIWCSQEWDRDITMDLIIYSRGAGYLEETIDGDIQYYMNTNPNREVVWTEAEFTRKEIS